MAALDPNTEQDCGVFGAALDFRTEQDCEVRKGDFRCTEWFPPPFLLDALVYSPFSAVGIGR